MKYALCFSNNVFEYVNNFVNMNMNTAESMGGNGALGRRRRRQLREIAFDMLERTTSRTPPGWLDLHAEAFIKRIYSCLV